MSMAKPIEGGIASYAFSDTDFAVIARRAQSEFGLHLTDAKRDLVYSRLSKRLRALGIADFGTYCKLIESTGPASDAERLHMISALTTNVTHFFREEHHFKTLRTKVLPPLIEAAKKGKKKVRIWSAGCSAGQEPYSIAFTLLELCPEAAQLDIRILATDVDPVILETARTGIYPADELKALPETARKFHTLAKGERNFAIAEKPRALISFGELNLMNDWPMRGPFDVIFCRNVAIYFDKPTQARLWSRFAALLPAGGLLCIGHSERISGDASDCLHLDGTTTYWKTATQ